MGIDPSAPTVPARPGGERHGRADAGERELPKGSAIGRYQVIERLGAGGMGVVHLVHDPELDRKIAVKLLRNDVGADPDRAARLKREAQAMAKLSHPNVVTIHDVGSHEAQSFIAMEFVDGRTLRQWLAEPGEKGRPWREVVDAFVRAGRGLSAAHSAGVVHRDFKPDNVMIARDGRVVVMDFGLARGEGDPSPSPPEKAPALDSPITRTGTLLGTPAYMSPEQVRGDSADARSDQFAFCVSLHEGLYGVRPFAPAEGENLDATDALSVAILEGRVRPEPEGTKVPAWVRKILLRGLSVAREERYPDMDALLAELAHDPAAARRRWLVAAAGLALLAAGGATGVLVWPRGQDRSQVCRGAERKLVGIWDDARRAEVRAAFAATGLDVAQSALGKTEEALDRYAGAWIAQHTDACEATELRREQSPEVRDLRMDCLDGRRRAMGTITTLLADANGDTVRSALTLVSRLDPLSDCDDVALLRRRRPAPADLATRREVDRLRDVVNQAEALQSLGRWDVAMTLVPPALAAAEATGYVPIQARVRALLGKLYGRFGQFELSVRTYREAAELAEGADDDELRVQVLTALVRGLGNLHRFEEAHEAARLAEEIIARRGLGGRFITALLHNQVNLNGTEGKPYAESLPLIDQALAIIARSEGPESQRYADYTQKRGDVLWGAERYDDARAEFEKARGLYERIGGPTMPEVGTVYQKLASLANSRGDSTGAIELHRKALDIYRSSYGPDHLATGQLIANLSNAYYQLDRHEEALEGYRRALEIFRKVFPPDHLMLAHMMASIASCHVYMKQPDQAIPLLREALRIREKHAQVKQPPRRAFIEHTLGWALWDSGGDKREARALVEKALADLQADGRKAEAAEVMDWLKKHRL